MLLLPLPPWWGEKAPLRPPSAYAPLLPPAKAPLLPPAYAEVLEGPGSMPWVREGSVLGLGWGT